MKQKFMTIATAAAVLLAAPAIAQQAKVKQDPAASINPSGLTIGDCLLILQGLERLDDKRSVVVNKGKPNETVVQEPYEFAKVGVMLDIARNIAVLNNIKRDTQPVQQKIFYQIVRSLPPVPAPKAGDPPVPATSIQPGTPQDEEFNAKMVELTSKPCSAQLARLNAADLELEKNRIPVGVLAMIDRILDK